MRKPFYAAFFVANPMPARPSVIRARVAGACERVDDTFRGGVNLVDLPRISDTTSCNHPGIRHPTKPKTNKQPRYKTYSFYFPERSTANLSTAEQRPDSCTMAMTLFDDSV
jgi:hypothetical protein